MEISIWRLTSTSISRAANLCAVLSDPLEMCSHHHLLRACRGCCARGGERPTRRFGVGQGVVISLVLHLSCVELTSEPALKEVIRAAASDVYVDRESEDSEACLF